MNSIADFVCFVCLACLVVLLVALPFGVYQSVKAEKAFRQKCTDGGGVPYIMRDGWMCIAKDKVIKVS